MRKILFSALLCASALAVSQAALAEGLSTAPSASGAMLIPTYTTDAVSVVPVRYYGHHHWRHHHNWRRHYR